MITTLPDLLEVIGEPDVVLMCGLPGSGKSYVAERIAERIGAQVLRSDSYRVAMFGGPIFSTNISDSEHKRRSKVAYDALYTDAARRVRSGEKVVIDATHLNHQRTQYIAEMKKLTQNLTIAVVHSPDSVVFDRVRRSPERVEQVSDIDRVRTIIQTQISSGLVSWPTSDSDGVAVFEYLNN